MTRDLDAEYDELMDELEAIIKRDAWSNPNTRRTTAIRIRIEALLREQFQMHHQSHASGGVPGQAETRH